MNTKRSPSYLEKIKHLPNVKLVSSSIPNWKIFEKTKIVIATSGTSVFEASILGMQTIQLGNLGTIKMLPNVHHHSDLKNIRQKINEILNQEVDKNKNHKRMLEYIHAAFKKGQKYDLWNNNLQNNINLKKELLENYCKEIERLTKLKV
jgi:lipid A disaccharide synthetase